MNYHKYNRIHQIKNDILDELNITKSQKKSFLSKLKNYKYVDEVPDIEYGAYIRWIPLNNIRLTNGGLVCDIIIEDGINILCKNNMGRFFQCNMNNCIIFQMLSNEEQVILSALKYVNQS